MTRIGIIGMGARAGAHAKALQEADDIEFAGFAEIDENNRKQAAEKYGVPAYEDYNDLIASGLDAVILVTPGFVRLEPVTAAAKAGVTSKPFCWAQWARLRLPSRVSRNSRGLWFCFGPKPPWNLAKAVFR